MGNALDATSHRGWFALIRKGSGAVSGVARLVGCGVPLSSEEMVATFEEHRIPKDMILGGQVSKWTTPWKLADVHKLASPVPYRHKPGAVTWVNLDESVSDAIARQLGELPAMPEAGEDQPEDRYVGAAPANRVPDLPPSGIASADGERPSKTGVSGRLVGEVEVTAGNISHNHIYLRSVFDKFPADAKGGSNRASAAKRELTVDWGGPEPVQTDLDGTKKFFRARSWIGEFYKLNRARPGDRVRIEETGPYRYRISLVRHAN